MQDGPKAVWSIPYVSMSFFPNLKQTFIAYRSSKVSDYNFKIHQLWQSGFSRVYPNSCCSCWFGLEIIKIGQSSDKMYSNNILNFQASTTILNALAKKVWNLIVRTSYIYIYIYSNINITIYIYIYIYIERERERERVTLTILCLIMKIPVILNPKYLLGAAQIPPIF